MGADAPAREPCLPLAYPGLHHLVLSGVGRLRLGDTVHVLDDAAKAGIVFARDSLGRLCLVAVGLEPTGGGTWRAVVEQVVRSRYDGSYERSREGRGTTFSFASRDPGDPGG